MFRKEELINTFKKLLVGATNLYDDFNIADKKISDGDLGLTILHGLKELYNNINKFNEDMRTNFIICFQVLVKKSSSSFGKLMTIV